MEKIQNQISKSFCGGPSDLDCTEPNDICFSVEGEQTLDSHAWGICVDSDLRIHFNNSQASTSSVTSTISVNTTVSASLGDSSSTPPVPVSTSTTVEVTTVPPPTLVTRTATTTSITTASPLPTHCENDLDCQEDFYCDLSECIMWKLTVTGDDICVGLCTAMIED